MNNVGYSYPYPERFLAVPEKQSVYHNILHCNVITLLQMVQIVMPAMVEQRKGVVINIASTAALIPSPMLSVYGASKVRKMRDKIVVVLHLTFTRENIQLETKIFEGKKMQFSLGMRMVAFFY